MCQQMNEKYLYLSCSTIRKSHRMSEGRRQERNASALNFPSSEVHNIHNPCLPSCSTIVLVQDNVPAQDAGEWLSLRDLETQLTFSQRPSVPRGPTRRPPRMPPFLSRAFNTMPSQRADVFPSQLHDPSAAAMLSSFRTAHAPQNLTEKVVERYCVGLKKDQRVKAGDFVTISPAHCMTHDNSWPTALKFMSIGASKIHNPRQVVMTLDHDVQNKSEKNLKKYRQIEEFAKKQGVDFYPAGRGIGHQIMIEEGFAFPGTLAVASDSHSNMYGGVGCLGTPVVRTDAASVSHLFRSISSHLVLHLRSYTFSGPVSRLKSDPEEDILTTGFLRSGPRENRGGKCRPSRK